ncbi:hypothetical protein MJ904_01770 [Massilia sp. MB5]|uniref:hypothetical protein n=1 Tax=Massilia sp. MB5 TaxID=2919578 RepID=UPI001F0F4359|nr:hypothetical protein [Massilia sp. MB5]UMR31021.1 hypothetical protein MJ904_01770 [Massilia sp. MB5]
MIITQACKLLTLFQTALLDPARAPLPLRGGPAAPPLARLAAPQHLLGLLVSAALGLLFARWLYGSAFLLGDTAFWRHSSNDITQYIAGFNAFVREPWHWPLLRIDAINWPAGTHATFLDTVPLYAMLLKLFYQGDSAAYWNPYGSYIALCYLLQGVGAWWLAREGGLRSWAALLALAVLLLSFPALSHRIHHTSLMSQWILLFGLAIYVRSSRLGRLAVLPWVALILASFYINIYLFCMVSVIFAADTVRHLRRGRLLAGAAPLLLAYAALALSLWATLLPLGASNGGQEWGFGFYSMNLLAPFTGGKLVRLAHATAHAGQGEGYNYLGLFFLGLLAAAYRLRRRLDPGFWQRHRVLLLLLTMMSVYALSTTVYLGSLQLLDWYLPQWTGRITSQLRASGRFFWPVGYAAMVFAVFTVARQHAWRQRGALLLAVAALQLWDLGEHHRDVRLGIQAGGPPLIDAARWTRFLGPQIDTLYFYPPFRCGKNVPAETVLPTMQYAVQQGLRFSTGYVSRLNPPCEGYAEQIAHARRDGTAFAFVRSEFPILAAVHELLGAGHAYQCIEADFVYLCKPAHPSSMENPQ